MNLIINNKRNINLSPLYILGPSTLSLQTSEKYQMNVYVFGEIHRSTDYPDCLKMLNTYCKTPREIFDFKQDKCVKKTSKRGKEIINNIKNKSIRIDHFLKKLLENTDVFIDFFFEVSAYKGLEYPVDYRPYDDMDNYLVTILKTFKTCIQASTRYNHLKKCRLGRVHYVDVRREQSLNTDILSFVTMTLMTYSTIDDDDFSQGQQFLQMPKIKEMFNILANYEKDKLKYTKLLKRQFLRNTYVRKELIRSYMGDEILEFVQKKLMTSANIIIPQISNLIHALYSNNNSAEDKNTYLSMLGYTLLLLNFVQDAYTLARMFKKFNNPKNQPAKPHNIIMYAGDSHSRLVREFLQEQGFTMKSFAGHDKTSLDNKNDDDGGCIDLSNFQMPLFS